MLPTTGKNIGMGQTNRARTLIAMRSTQTNGTEKSRTRVRVARNSQAAAAAGEEGTKFIHATVVGYIPHGEEEDEYEMWHVIHDDGAQKTACCSTGCVWCPS